MMIKKRFFSFQVNRFVILFVERAGSTYLTTLLNSHPEIRCVTEKLDALKIDGKGAQEQLAWTDDYLTPEKFGQNRAIGFKSKQVDILDPEGFKILLTRKKCRIIQLQRRNSVKGVVSTLNARRLWEASGKWNLIKEGDRRSPFAIDPIEFKQLLEKREEWDRDLENYVNQLGLDTIKLHYEDLLENEDVFQQQVLNFLGVSTQPTQGKTIKHTKDDLKEVIINFDDLRAEYANTKYETMFDEVLQNS